MNLVNTFSTNPYFSEEWKQIEQWQSFIIEKYSSPTNIGTEQEAEKKKRSVSIHKAVGRVIHHKITKPEASMEEKGLTVYELSQIEQKISQLKLPFSEVWKSDSARYWSALLNLILTDGEEESLLDKWEHHLSGRESVSCPDESEDRAQPSTWLSLIYLGKSWCD